MLRQWEAIPFSRSFPGNGLWICTALWTRNRVWATELCTDGTTTSSQSSRDEIRQAVEKDFRLPCRLSPRGKEPRT